MKGNIHTTNYFKHLKTAQIILYSFRKAMCVYSCV